MNKDRQLTDAKLASFTQPMPTRTNGKGRFPEFGSFWGPFSKDNVLNKAKGSEIQREQVATPAHVIKVRCEVSSVTVGGVAKSQQDVRFATVDRNFAGAKIWLKGYNRGTSALSAKLPWDMVADVHESPSSFLLDPTTETVIIGVQAYNNNGQVAPFDTMPTVTKDLI